MKKVEINPVVAIIALVATLLIGMLSGAVSVGKYLVKKFKKSLSDLKKQHAKDLKCKEDKYTSIIEGKDKANKKYREIIDELINLFYEKDEKGRAVADTILGASFLSQIRKQRDRLN